MPETSNGVMSKMLDRLFASMVNGPSMNCRPHASRQRIDLAQFSKFRDVEPGKAFLELLGDNCVAKLAAKVSPPARKQEREIVQNGDVEDAELSPEERATRRAWTEQSSLLTKLRVIADDARTYEQDTGAHVLEIGFPLLSLPPGSFGGRAGLSTRRILAPIAFIPISLKITTGARQVVEFSCRGEGVDRVRPNIALLAWLEQQTGQQRLDLFADEAGEEPWREISELVRVVAEQVEVAIPELFKGSNAPTALDLLSTPKTDDDAGQGKAIVSSAVIGLFPVSSQGLLRDTSEMVANGLPEGPIQSFVSLGSRLDQVDSNVDQSGPSEDTTVLSARSFASERLVSRADPCQTRAVRLARQCSGLVVHGPPGTGKSQTIANIIGDHLARGERVLFVCDKRTALDVVADRLRALGLGDLLATVHDPQRDQREFYRSVREQLDNLSDLQPKTEARRKLDRIDQELQTLHDELTRYHRSLMGNHGGSGSFHHLVGLWLGETGEVGDALDERELQNIPAAEFDRHWQRLKELLERGEAISYSKNPWVEAAKGISLPSFLATSANLHAAAIGKCVKAAEVCDSTIDQHAIPFGPTDDLNVEAERQLGLAAQLRQMPKLASAAIEHWFQQPPQAAKAALKQLQQASKLVTSIEQQPLDAGLLTKATQQAIEALAIAANGPLSAYAVKFRSIAGQLLAAAGRAGSAGLPLALKWISAADQKRSSAHKRLEGAAGLAKLIEGQPLDAQLHARHLATPIDSAKTTEWLAALNAYLDIAGKWTAIFKSAVKKSAEPPVKQFGLSLNADSARNVKQFLEALQTRRDLQAAVEAGTGERFETEPDDTELLAAYESNRSVLESLKRNPSNEASNDEIQKLSAEIVTAINKLTQNELDQVRPVLEAFTLSALPASADELALFNANLSVLRSLATVLNSSASTISLEWPLPAGAKLIQLRQDHVALLELIGQFPAKTPLGDAAAHALLQPERRDAIVVALENAPRRVAAIQHFSAATTSAQLYATSFIEKLDRLARQGSRLQPAMLKLTQAADTVEGVLRIADGLANLPSSLSQPAATLLSKGLKASDGYSTIRRNVLAGEITKRLRDNPDLQNVDGHRLANSFNRFRELTEQKKEVVRDDIASLWITRQKARLLASTGTRLNSIGANLQRRLTLRGQRATRLRQIIAQGREVEGGDPLFELRPVWMASPETVAQLFAREPIFDVIVFDEASQCRLEEALPVLTRGKRIVIAGDPKQLPPTRFFESAVATSEDAEAETDQEFFEQHQGEVEDLLTAALSLEGVEQSYLNVHYRSRNSDLIGFSNEHFYGSRLQAIPAHPNKKIRYAPITLHRADGTYEKRRNLVEAEKVCEIVDTLLRRNQPPSIGIACFNMVQRDLIVEKLEERAENDAEFARRLGESRERQGQGSTEGLFVKNLENVQGDERDHLIISTTYGPDNEGKFHKRFGPLGMPGGGRRLNVLITRARDELHIVTSIPRSAYTALPAVPQNATAGGAWLLFAYLKFVEELQAEYELNQRVLQSSEAAAVGTTTIQPSRTPSQFAKALGTKLAKAGNMSSVVHWGNEGFSVDLAMLDPARAEDVTIGVQCDLTRFAGSDDPVEWDMFQSMIHENQGWKLQRVWTPHFFRDSDRVLASIKVAVNDAATGVTLPATTK